MTLFEQCSPNLSIFRAKQTLNFFVGPCINTVLIFIGRKQRKKTIDICCCQDLLKLRRSHDYQYAHTGYFTTSCAATNVNVKFIKGRSYLSSLQTHRNERQYEPGPYLPYPPLT